MNTEAIIDSCREKEFHAYGTTRIFEKRANKLQLLRTWITFLGIVTPVIVGGSVLAFGVEAEALPYFLVVAGIVGIAQLTLSTWSIVARWDERYGYAIESARDNTRLYNEFKMLADRQPFDLEEKHSKALELYNAREFQDIAQNISDKEKRFANRESLKYYKKPCQVCSSVPKTSKPSKCDGCGNF